MRLLVPVLLFALGAPEEAPGIEPPEQAPASEPAPAESLDDAPSDPQPSEAQPLDDPPASEDPPLEGDPFAEETFVPTTRPTHEFVEQPTTDVQGRHGPRPPKRLPPVYGPLLVTAGIGAGPGAVGLGGAVTYFVVPWVGVGADLDETVLFGSGPVINDFTVGGHVMIIPMPYFRVSPYIRGGLGPEFFSGGLGIYGLWRAGAGMIIRFGRAQMVALRLGASVRGRFPDSRFADNFVCGWVDNPCSLRIVPEFGLAFSFGGRRR